MEENLIEIKKMVTDYCESLKDARYYEELVEGRIPSRTGVEKAIQMLTKKDAGVVLAMIGMNHPATEIVYKYLVQQKLDQYSNRGGYLLQRRRNIRNLTVDHIHKRVSGPRDQDSAAGSAF